MKKFTGYIFAVVIALSSCTHSNYIDAIPHNCNALIAVDTKELKGLIGKDLLSSLLSIDDKAGYGLDLSEKIYLFEAADGNVGLCAKVADEDNLEKVLDRLVEQGIAVKSRKRRGKNFFVLKDSWLIGYSSEALLIMGPMTAESQGTVQNRMAKYLDAENETGVKGTPIYEKLISINAPIALVTRIGAIPEKFVLPFTMGIPKDADLNHILLAVQMQLDDDVLRIEGEIFSFHKNIDKELKKAYSIYRPIKNRYLKAMPATASVGLFMNVNGKDLIKQIHDNRSLSMLLAGANIVIDMDNILKSVDGDMAFILPSLWEEGMFKMSMVADLATANWLKDVEYWKKSCPSDAQIENVGPQVYAYHDKNTTFYFGVTPDLRFYSGPVLQNAKATLHGVNNPIAPKIQNEIQGKKLVMVLQLSPLMSQEKDISLLLNPFLGNLKTVVYSVK